jgi:hypothetical protein
MSLFGFGDKKEKIPPDVGQESSEEGVVNPNSFFNQENSDEEIVDSKFKKGNSSDAKTSKQRGGKAGGLPEEIQLEKINAKIELLDSWIKGSQEKFSAINEKIGEIRSSLMKNEKEVSKAILISSKASELVKEVEPEKLASHYFKLNARIEALSEKIISMIEYSTMLTNEIKELKRKSDLFVGTESLLNLNEETKKNLLDIQKINSKVKLNADKTEQYFIEIKGFLSENQRIEQKVNLIDSTVASIKREMQRLNLDLSNVIMKKEFESFSKAINNKFSNSEFFMRDLSKIDEEYARLGKIIETTLGISQKNKRDIENISVLLGREEGEKSNKYAEQLSHLLNIIDKLSEDIENMKKGNSKPGVEIQRKENPKSGAEMQKKETPKPSEQTSSNEVADDTVDEINSLLLKGNELLKNGDKNSAREIYLRITSSYNLLSNSSKEKVYSGMVNFYNNLEPK